MKSVYNSKKEIHERALKIKGIPFDDISQTKDVSQKNYVGDLFESWFGKRKDSASEADLEIVELKTTPYRKLKRGKNKYSSKERLVLNIINYMNIVDENFKDSHFLHKNKSIEIGFYEYIKGISKQKYSFSDVILYEMGKNPIDYKIIEGDWKIIQKYVADGRAEDLSESLTTYLSACTKGENKNELAKQPFSEVMAKRRAFSLKQGYMTQILRNNVLGDEKVESIIKNVEDLKDSSLKEIISKKFDKFIGKSVSSLKTLFDINSNSKSINNIIVRHILGLNNGNKIDLLSIDELNKEMYMIKTVQFDENKINGQNMSFPVFNFKELCEEKWTDEEGKPSADLNIMFSEGTLIFCVFQKDNTGNVIFKGYRFYNVPQQDVDGEIKKCWQETVEVLKNGVQLEYKKTKESFYIKNNLPKKSENTIIHVRPHSGKSSYVNNAKSNQLPVKASWSNKPSDFSNDYMTNQCFFLNNTYIKSLVKDLLD